MRALVQRVSRASVSAGGEKLAEIGPGLMVLLAVGHGDTEAEAQRLGERVLALRLFEDAEGKMNESLGEREVLCVSQFTLYADTSKGNRPGFGDAAPAELAQKLYERFCDSVGAERGRFGARMAVELVNDGPVTVLLEA